MEHSDGVSMKNNNNALLDLTEELSNGISLTAFQAKLLEAKQAGFDPNYISRGVNQYKSLLKACLLNPTDENFKIFKYLIENKLVAIEDQLDAKSVDFDSQKDPKNPEAIKKFLDYIDENTDDKQKNECQLFNLALFFNYQELFDKLLQNNNIDIGSSGQRAGLPIGDIVMSNQRPEIARSFITSSRFTEAQTGQLRNDLIIQTFYLNNDLIEELLKPNKLPSYSNFNDAVQNSFSSMIFSNKQKDKVIKVYNAASIDPLAMLASPLFRAQLQQVKPNESAQVDYVFLCLPSLIDFVIQTRYNMAGEPIPSLELPKLAFILERVKILDGLDFSKIASDEHKELIAGMNELSDKDISRLAATLDIKEDAKIKAFCNDLRSLCSNDPKALTGIEKLENGMQDLRLQQDMNPVSRFFYLLFTDPAQLFSKPKAITSANPLKCTYRSPEMMDAISKEVKYMQQNHSKTANTTGINLTHLEIPMETLDKMQEARDNAPKQEQWKFSEAEIARRILEQTKEKHMSNNESGERGR